MAGGSGAEPEPMQRRQVRSTPDSSASFCSSSIRIAGGAIAYSGRSAAICRRYTGSSKGWCSSSVPEACSQLVRQPPMAAMFTSGKGFSSRSPSRSCAPS